MTTKVSIIIPVYNVAPYVEDCIRSVMNQTMTEGVECIIVDDCGQDNSMEIVERIVAGYKGYIDFRILHHDHNRGLSAARNTGIDSAKGEYIYYLDSDDKIVPDCIEKLVSSEKKHPDSQIVFAGAEASADNYKWLDYTTKELPEYSDNQDWLQRSMLKRCDFGMTAWNKLISRKFICENGLRFVEGLVHEDEVWNFDLSKYIQSAAFVKHNTYLYNIHDNSITVGASDNLRWERLFALWNVLLSKLDDDQKEMQIRAIFTHVLVETRKKFPVKHRKSLSELFHDISRQAKGTLFFRLSVMRILALSVPSKYWNLCAR